MALQSINYGPLVQLFKSEDITEVMVNAWNKIYVEHKGILVLTKLKFPSEKDYNYLLQTIIDQCLENDTSYRSAYEGVLDQGYRFNITLPPLTPNSSTLTIRKFSNKAFTLDDLIQKKSISDKAAIFLKEAIQNQLTILISGGTGTGKTSLLNSFALYIPENERVISIEDTLELRSQQSNWISMLTQRNQIKSMTARDCLVNSLRMRPNRIIIGECRGPEAYDFLQAINTGHEGSMTTLHANSASDALSRLENLVTLGHAEIPLKYLRKQISDSIDLIVQLKRFPNGERKIVEIMELTGMEQDTITRGTIFEWNKNSLSLETTGYVPSCLTKINHEHTNIGTHFFEVQKTLPKVG